MSSERQLLLDRKDAHSLPLARFNLRLSRQNESCFRKIHLASERLHFLVGQTSRVWETCERITREQCSRKNIELHKFVSARHNSVFLLKDQTLNHQRSVNRDCASFHTRSVTTDADSLRASLAD